MRSAIVLIGEKVPEKKLIREITYRYLPDKILSDTIFKDLVENMRVESPVNSTMELDIRVTIKEYTDAVPQKEFWYSKKPNDTKNS